MEKFKELKKKLNEEKNKIEKCKTAEELGDCYTEQNEYKTAVHYYHMSLDIAENISDKNYIKQILHKISNIYKKTENYNKLFNIQEEMLPILKDIGTEYEILICYNTMGTAKRKLSQYNEAAVYYNNSLQIAEKSDKIKYKAIPLNNLGNLYSDTCNLDTALDYYLQALEALEKGQSDKIESKASILNNIGIIYNIFGNQEKSLEYQKKAIEIKEKIGDKLSIANSYQNMGNIYIEIFRNSENDFSILDKALEFLSKALNLYLETENKAGYAASYNNIGYVHLKKEEYDNALECFFKSYEFKLQIEDKKGAANTLSNIGIVFMRKNEYEKSEEYLKNSLEIAEEIGANDLLKDVYENLYEIYNKINNVEEAFKYYKKYADKRFEIINEESSRKMLEIQTKYEMEQKLREAEIYKHKNIELANANEKLQKANYEIEEKRKHLESALSNIKTLKGLIPICAVCKKIRDDEGYWHQLEQYIYTHSEAELSHGICPDCLKEHYPEIYKKHYDKDSEN